MPVRRDTLTLAQRADEAVSEAKRLHVQGESLMRDIGDTRALVEKSSLELAWFRSAAALALGQLRKTKRMASVQQSYRQSHGAERRLQSARR